MKFYVMPLAVIASLALTACSNPSSPSDANFKKAIETKLNETGAAGNCLFVFLDERAESSYKQDSFLQALIKNDYVKATQVPRTAQSVFYYSKTPWYQFELTAKGQQAFKNGQFCYGQPVVTDITNYSLGKVPETGQTFATVTYNYKVENVPDWLTKDLVTCSGLVCSKINLKIDFQNSQMNLLQGAKGWQPAGLF